MLMIFIAAFRNFLTWDNSLSFPRCLYLCCRSPPPFSRKEPWHLRLLTFKAQQRMSACAKDLGKVRSHDQWCESVSLVSRREVVSTDTLSNSQHLSVSAGLLGFMPCLSSYNLPVWEHMCLGGGVHLKVMHYKFVGESLLPSKSCWAQTPMSGSYTSLHITLCSFADKQ